MRVYKDTPFELTFMPWELEPPSTTLVVVVKATFALGDEGPATIAEPQVPCLGPVPWEDGDTPSLRTETDYAILKPRAEWYLTGSAYAPGGAPATLVPVRVRVGALEKAMAVWGDRVWERGVVGSKPSPPQPFTTMPLRWERSFGGPRFAANPVGRGIEPLAAEGGPLDALPNLEEVARPILSREDRPTPTGMFAIPGTWRSRAALTGTYDELWKVSRWPFLPKDFDWAFFNCAPLDQRRDGYWRGDEPIELHGLHPTLPRLRTRLPGLTPRFFVEWHRPGEGPDTPLLDRASLLARGRPRLEELALRLDTIVIDTDLAVVQCQWRGLLRVRDAVLTDVSRFFVVHEPLGAEAPGAHYEEWLQRKLLEEADEFAPEADAPLALPAPSGAALGALPTAQEMAEHLRREAAELALAIDEARRPDPPLPDPDEVRDRYRELGLDAEAILPPIEPSHVPVLEEPPSLLRLAAIVRRKLGRSFAGLDLTDAPYRGLDLSGVDLRGAVLTGADLGRANLTRARLDGALLVRARLYGTDLYEASLVDADLSEVDATYARFARGNLDGMVASNGVFERATFHQASLAGAELVGCDLRACDLRECRLDEADLTGSVIEDAAFGASSMVDTSLEGVRGARANFDRARMPDLRASDGADFTQASFVLVDAPRAQLQRATLIGASFAGSNLEEADLSESRAERINLVRCVLRTARLDGADLRGALLMAADLFEASLSSAILSGADARGAHLFSANLWRAYTDGTLFDGAQLDRTLLGRR